MRMLEAGEEDDRSVTAEDQEQINHFSKLNRRLDDILDDIQRKKDSKEALDDLTTELELEDEDELVPYQIQSAFVHLPVKDVLELTNAKCDKITAALESLDAEAEQCKEGMTKLKVELYAKFGKSINLERGD